MGGGGNIHIYSIYKLIEFDLIQFNLCVNGERRVDLGVVDRSRGGGVSRRAPPRKSSPRLDHAHTHTQNTHTHTGDAVPAVHRAGDGRGHAAEGAGAARGDFDDWWWWWW